VGGNNTLRGLDASNYQECLELFFGAMNYAFKAEKPYKNHTKSLKIKKIFWSVPVFKTENEYLPTYNPIFGTIGTSYLILCHAVCKWDRCFVQLFDNSQSIKYFTI
jgi:hypothetical protein